MLQAIRNHADLIATLKWWTMGVCILGFGGIIAWDVFICCIDQTPQSPTVSHVLREGNRLSGGLIAMGWIIVGIHLFFNQWLPTPWRDPT